MKRQHSQNARKKLTASEKQWLIDFLKDNPTIGIVEPGTLGARKMRLPAQGRGKSGGYRLIYFYWTSEHQIWLIDIYAKNEKELISKKELRTIITTIKD